MYGNTVSRNYSCSQYSTQATLYVHTIQSNFHITDLCKIYLLYLGIVLSVLKSNQPAPFDVTSCIKWQRSFQKQQKSSQHTTVQPLDVTWPILLTINHEDVWTAQVAINCQNGTRSKHTPFNWTSCAGSTGLKRFLFVVCLYSNPDINCAAAMMNILKLPRSCLTLLIEKAARLL